MKTFMLVAMLLALLVAAYLVVKDMQSVTTGSGPAQIKAVQRAVESNRKVEAANQEQERRLDAAAKE